MPRPKIPASAEAAIAAAVAAHPRAGAPELVKLLAAQGVRVGQRTIGERLAKLERRPVPAPKLRASKAPAAKRPRKAPSSKASLPATPSPAPSADPLAFLDRGRPPALSPKVPGATPPAEPLPAPPADPPPVGDPDTLPVLVLASGIQAADAGFRAAVAKGDLPEAERLARVVESFASRLVACRPPVEVAPERDPLNVEARRAVVERLELLVRPLEGSPQVVAAMRLHVEGLERQLAAALPMYGAP